MLAALGGVGGYTWYETYNVCGGALTTVAGHSFRIHLGKNLTHEIYHFILVLNLSHMKKKKKTSLVNRFKKEEQRLETK